MVQKSHFCDCLTKLAYDGTVAKTLEKLQIEHRQLQDGLCRETEIIKLYKLKQTHERTKRDAGEDQLMATLVNSMSIDLRVSCISAF